MLKKEPRTFWMIVNVITFIVCLLLCVFLGEYNKMDNFMLMNSLNKLFLLYFALHIIILAIHGIYLLATTDEL